MAGLEIQNIFLVCLCESDYIISRDCVNILNN